MSLHRAIRSSSATAWVTGERPVSGVLQLGYAAAAILAAGFTTAWHRQWSTAVDGTPRRGLFDGLCHMGTALAVTLPVLPYVRDRSGVLRVAVISALALDLDHVLAARSIRLQRCMTMEHRPASHSMLTPLLLALATERWRPERHLGLGALLGIGSHLLRDLGTGGAPLVHPKRIITAPYGVVVFLLGTLSFTSRQATRTAIGGQILARRLLRRLLT